ncbi:MAG TPA: hypothetical protein VE521_01970 [Nitrososphaera sp.]|jgi:hypothetical protein|nr:hypothetical protein [Nitrososphaera sp.]
MTTTKKVSTYYLPLAAVLITAAAVVAVPFQQAAYAQDTEFLVRLVQGTAQTGLVNVSVQVGSVIVSDTVDVTGNNIAVGPIAIPVAANVNVGALVCATILSTDDQVCRFVQNVQQDAENRVTLNLRQAQ